MITQLIQVSLLLETCSLQLFGHAALIRFSPASRHRGSSNRFSSMPQTDMFFKHFHGMLTKAVACSRVLRRNHVPEDHTRTMATIIKLMKTLRARAGKDLKNLDKYHTKLREKELAKRVAQNGRAKARGCAKPRGRSQRNGLQMDVANVDLTHASMP